MPIKTFFKNIFWKLLEHRVVRDATGVIFTCEEERLLARHSFTPYGLGSTGVVVFARTFHLGESIRAFISVFYGARNTRNWRALFYRSHRRLPLRPADDVRMRVFSQVHRPLPNARVLCRISRDTGLVRPLAARITSILENSGHSLGLLRRDRDCNRAVRAPAATG